MKKLLLLLFIVFPLSAQHLVYIYNGVAYLRNGNGELGTDSVFTATAIVDTVSSNGVASKYYVSQHQGTIIDSTTLFANRWGGITQQIVLQLPADTTTGANVTPIDLRSMVFSYAANSTYVFDMYMIGNSAAATTGQGYQLNVSSAVTAIAMGFYHQLANTGTLSGGSSIADDASVGVSSGLPTLNVNVPVLGQGLLVTGANTGTAQFRLRSKTTAATTCKAGSTIIVRKVK